MQHIMRTSLVSLVVFLFYLMERCRIHTCNTYSNKKKSVLFMQYIGKVVMVGWNKKTLLFKMKRYFLLKVGGLRVLNGHLTAHTIIYQKLKRRLRSMISNGNSYSTY